MTEAGIYISAKVVYCDAMAQISLSESIKQITLPNPLLSFDSSGEEKKMSKVEGSLRPDDFCDSFLQELPG